MGCISSKLVTRSTSFQEEFNKQFQRSRRRGFPMLEEIVISRNGGDGQLLALVCTANSVSKKLGSQSFISDCTESSPEMKIFGEPLKAETINTWELMAGLEEEEEELSLSRVTESSDITRRSNSFHMSSEKEYSFMGRIGRSKSFHTVHEFDAMLLMNQSSKKPESSGVLVKSGGSYASETADACSNEKGTRRKAMAKELTSLAIPASTIDFAVNVDLREEMEVWCRGAYVTPKFGSFCVPDSRKKRKQSESHEESVFDPELVSEFEEDMQLLRLEEEFVLQQIKEELEEKKDDDGDDVSDQLHLKSSS